MLNKAGGALLWLVFLVVIASAALFGGGLPQSMPVQAAGAKAPPVITAPATSPAPVAAKTSTFTLTDKRRVHILTGDETGGGHKAGMGRPGKTKFPASWDDQKITDAIMQIANDPSLPMRASGRYWLKTNVLEGVGIRVVLDRERGEVVTGYPLALSKR